MVTFGFSVGDFVAGISLIIDAVHSLSDTHGAPADYEELGRQLKNLRNGFECIEGLNLYVTQCAQRSAVDTALNDCRLCLDDFVKRNGKIKSLEAPSGRQWSLAALKRQGRKVQWALWKKADVAKFRGAIQQHSDAVQMLLASIQIKQIGTQGKLQATAERQNIEHKSLTQEVHRGVSDLSLQQQRMETMLEDGQASLAQALRHQYQGTRDKIQVCERNQEEALAAHDKTTMQVLSEVENINSKVGSLMGLEKSRAGDASALIEQLFTIIENQQEMMALLRNMKALAEVSREIPAQVLLSKPVVLLDARGRYAPFHLEFIDSAEAFIAVLKVRFKDVGLRKIESGEFALEDSRLKRGLQLTKPWAAVVRPGQHISMSMVFRLEDKRTARCPGCGKENAGSDLEDVECGNTLCGIVYRRIIQERPASSKQSDIFRKAESGHLYLSGSEPQPKEITLPEESANDEMQHYTRLHILTQAITKEEHTAAFTSSRRPSDDELYAMRAFAPVQIAERHNACKPLSLNPKPSVSPVSPSPAASILSLTSVPAAMINGPPPSNVHRVELDFKTSVDDELDLRSGQLVKSLHEYNDGWVSFPQDAIANLQRHLRTSRRHSKDAGLKCPLSECRTRGPMRSDNLDPHLLIQSPYSLDVPFSAPTIPSSPSEYHCLHPNCGHTSSRAHDLKRHMTIHFPPPVEDLLSDCKYGWCGRTGAHGFKREDLRKEHYRKVHMKESEYPKLGKRGTSGRSGGIDWSIAGSGQA